MSNPRVIVCERTGAWAAVVGRRLPPGTRLRQVRSLVSCREELTAAPSSLLILELTGQNLAPLVEMIGNLRREFSDARVVVVAERGLEPCELLLREAGAIHFTSSPRELAGWNRMVENHLEHGPGGNQGFADEVWESLPWDG